MPPVVRNQLDYYAVLEIAPSACTGEVNAAFRRLAWRYHPDRNPTPGATLQFQDINEAHQVLTDPVRRAEYDAKWHPKHGDRRSSPQVPLRSHYRRHWHQRRHARTVVLAVFAVMFVSSAWAVIFNTMMIAHAGGFSFAFEAPSTPHADISTTCAYSMEIVPVRYVDARGREAMGWAADVQDCLGGVTRLTGRPQFPLVQGSRPFEPTITR